MIPYRYLDHTSEAKFQAYGKTLEEAFSNAALAMFHLVYEPSKVNGKDEKKIRITAHSNTALLFDFLDKLIFIQDEGFLLNKVVELRIKNMNLTATLLVDDHKNYATLGEVKAPTYNDMLIEFDEKKKVYVVQCVVDV